MPVAEKPKIEKVVKNDVSVKKKNAVQKISGSIFRENAGSIKAYVLEDVIIPAIRNLLYDASENTLRMIFLNGESRGNNYRGNSRGTSRVSYSRYYDEKDDRARSRERNTYRSIYNFDDIEFNDRVDAEEVLDRMGDIVDAYGIVSVGEFYELSGENPKHTDYKYGWTSIATASIVRLHNGGWMIRFPRATAID